MSLSIKYLAVKQSIFCHVSRALIIGLHNVFHLSETNTIMLAKFSCLVFSCFCYECLLQCKSETSSLVVDTSKEMPLTSDLNHFSKKENSRYRAISSMLDFQRCYFDPHEPRYTAIRWLVSRSAINGLTDLKK